MLSVVYNGRSANPSEESNKPLFVVEVRIVLQPIEYDLLFHGLRHLREGTPSFYLVEPEVTARRVFQSNSRLGMIPMRAGLLTEMSKLFGRGSMFRPVEGMVMGLEDEVLSFGQPGRPIPGGSVAFESNLRASTQFTIVMISA